MRELVALCLLCANFVVFAEQYSLSPPQVSELSASSVAVNQYNWRQDVANLKAPGGVAELPPPEITPRVPLHLGMREAILLSLRNNPDIQSTELTRITDKFALVLAHHFFEPQYTLGGSAVFAQGNQPVYTSNAGVTLNNSIGTQFSANYYNTYGTRGGDGAGQTAFTVTQPLLKGFGDVNTITWFDALDSENAARLSFKSSMMAQVVAVVMAYRQLIEDYQNLAIQERNLTSSAAMVKQAKLQFRVGHLAHSDLLQQQANYETTQLSLLSQKSSLISDYQNFLQLLGLKASAKVEIDKHLPVETVKIPSVQQAIDAALAGNIAYQQLLISVAAAQRAVVAAKDQARWQLDVTGSFNIANQVSEPTFVTVDGVTTVQRYPVQGSPSATLNLTIPIDDVAEKQAIVSARVALEQVKLAIESAKLELAGRITSEVQQLENQMRTLQSAKRQVAFQKQTYEAAKIKYQYGRTTTFELNQIKDQLLSQETALVSTRIGLMNQMTTLDQDLGLTLSDWKIELRY